MMSQEDSVEDSAFTYEELSRIIHSTRQIRYMVQEKANELLLLQRNFFRELGNLTLDSTVEQKTRDLIESLKLDQLNKQIAADRVQLALVGENSCGKTALVHFLLASDPFLPSGVGSVSARIIRLTYADGRDACLRVYQSLKQKNEEPTDEISLRDCFADSEANWSALRSIIEPYVIRPNAEKIEKTSNEFAEWAKQFVEIRIPSNFLKLGIDLYDTPGLLYSDPPILKQNLHDLVEVIHPTVIFLYENPSVQIDTKDCYLFLREAIGKQTDDLNIFFLNTKADIGVLTTEENNISTPEFETKVLPQQRQLRKDLLLKAPGMAQDINDKNGFDIISVASEWDSLGQVMNKQTIDHIIQFVLSADLKVAKIVSAKILSIINLFFEFTMVTNHRTLEQLKELYRNACQWVNDYFIGRRDNFDAVLRQLFDDIINELNENMNSIIRRAENKGSAENIRKYIRTLVQHEIVRVRVNKSIEVNATMSILETLFSPTILRYGHKNELIVAAQRMISDDLLNANDETACRLFLCMTTVKCFLLIGDILIETDDEDVKSTSKRRKTNVDELKINIRKKTIKTSAVLKNATPFDIAQQYLNDMRLGFINQKNSLNELLQFWSEQQSNLLHEKINQQYELAEKYLPQRKLISNTSNRYVGQYASIECKMIIARDLITFNGHVPTVNCEQRIDIYKNKFAEFYPAEWSDKRNLIAKKLNINDNYLKYIEAHYHRKVTTLDKLRFLPLLYLYENDNGELWMFFPKYASLENNTDKLTINNVFKIILTIAKCIQHMHANELVHGNISVQNIFYNDDNEYLLGDFGLDTTYNTLEEFVDRHNINESHRGANDICAFGSISLSLLEASKGKEKMNPETLKILKNLLGQCMDGDHMSRPTISNIIQKLNNLSQSLDMEKLNIHISPSTGTSSLSITIELHN